MAQAAQPNWVQVTDHAAWAPRDSCGELVLGDRMWLCGGWFDSYSLGPRDVWSSTDGRQWDLVTAEAGWTHGDLPTSLVFDDRLWMMGGWAAGRLPEGGPTSSVWASRDGAQWDCVTPAAGWSPRLAAAGAVFQEALWLTGGSEQYFFGSDDDQRSDVWRSADGEHWTQVTAAAPWSARAYHRAAAFRDRLWVFGGGQYLPAYRGLNDVWCSDDGEHWTQVTAHAPWPARIWFESVVWRDCLWLLGGWSNDPSRNWNDVWYTADGETWQQLVTPDIWSERHEQSVWVFQDRLWVAGGMAWPLVNDVWVLDLPADWQP